MDSAKMETLVRSTETKVLPVSLLVENPNNVNEMDDAAFNALCEGITESGYVPTIDVAPLPDGRYLIVDGNHRTKAAKLLGYTELTCTVLVGLDDADLQEILSARIAVVRGSVNRTQFTKLWLKVRQSLDHQQAMHILGVTSERQLNQLVNAAKRKTDTQTITKDAVQAMIARGKVVENLATVIRAAAGDGGLGEFEYLIFQVHGSTLLLVRCKADDMEALQALVSDAEARKISVAGAFVGGLRQLLHGEAPTA